MKATRTSLIVAAAVQLVAAGCRATAGAPATPIAPLAVTVTGAPTLTPESPVPGRSASYPLGDHASLPRLVFAEPQEDVALAQLREVVGLFFTPAASYGEVADNGDSLALSLLGAAAWVAKGSGAFALHDLQGTHGQTVIASDSDAVQRALKQVEEKRLLRLGEHESLDVLSVSSTHYAAWKDNEEGTAVPIHMELVVGAEAVTEFVSEYTVAFGRRYRGVPIVGSKAVAVLDATGRLVSFSRLWRDIAGESGEVALRNDKEMKAQIDPQLLRRRTIARVNCGYLESSPVGQRQAEPGIGCRYVLSSESSDIDREIVVLVSAVADGSVPLEGEAVDYSSQAPPVQTTDED